VARNQVEWHYTSMISPFYSEIDATEGIFGLTVKSEWKISPRIRVTQFIRVLLTPWRTFTRASNLKFAIDASMHLYDYEIRATATTSCHVTILHHGSDSPVIEFDLPSTPGEEFTTALERIGNAKVEHPWFLNDKNPYEEGVSLNGAVTRVTFVPQGN